MARIIGNLPLREYAGDSALPQVRLSSPLICSVCPRSSHEHVLVHEGVWIAEDMPEIKIAERESNGMKRSLTASPKRVGFPIVAIRTPMCLHLADSEGIACALSCLSCAFTTSHGRHCCQLNCFSSQCPAVYCGEGCIDTEKASPEQILLRLI